MRIVVLALGGVLLLGCGADAPAPTRVAGDPQAPAGAADDATDGDSSGSAPGPVYPGGVATQAPTDTCAGAAELDFRVSGSGLAQWEGRRVVAAAIESDQDRAVERHRRPVLVSAAITGGAFSLSCADSLHTNYWYPSFAVFVDVDGDGRCGAGDVGHQSQRYGWDRDLTEEIQSAADFSGWQPIGTGSAGLGIPVGSAASTFCAAYFD